jgi:hypothetical protein
VLGPSRSKIVQIGSFLRHQTSLVLGLKSIAPKEESLLGLVLYSCLALGWVGVSVAGVRLFIKNRAPRDVDFFSANLVCLSLVHALILMRIPLSLISKVFLGSGVVFFAAICFKLIRNPKFNVRSLVGSGYFWVAAISLFLLFKCLMEGINRWDPQSIYFFHAKIIYFAGKFPIEPWGLREIDFSHRDYPKLTACLAALIAKTIGYWNEYWPQLACSTLMLVLQQGVFSLPLKLKYRFVIQVVLFSVPGYFLWVGDQDGYLAGFIFVSLLYLGIGFRSQDNLLIRCGLLNLIVAMQIKNEGLVLALTILGISLLLKPKPVIRAGLALMPCLALLPVLIWTGYRLKYGIRNDLAMGFQPEVVFSRILSWRLFWKDFLTFYFLKTSLLWTLLVSLCAFAGLKRYQLWKTDSSVALAALSCLSYSAVLTFVYLSTFWELVEHLRTSVSRVAFTPALILLGVVLLASPITQVTKGLQAK